MTAEHLASAGVLVLASTGQVLMVENPYRQGLVLPGGMVEADESPGTAAEREVCEETGLTVHIDALLVVEHKAPRPSKPASLQFVFGTGPVPTDVTLTAPLDEVMGLHWLEPQVALERCLPIGRRRFALAFRAHAERRTFYLDADRELPAS